MRIPIEDDFSSGTKIIIEECEREILSNNQTHINDDVTIIDTIYDESTKEEVYANEYTEFYSNQISEEKYVDSSISGNITVVSKLGSINGALISSAKINLYMLNGLSPKLIDTKLSDEEGVVVFDNLDAGSYRIIAIVDRKYFDKPTYFDWNEVTLDKEMKEAKITVVNKIKSNFKK